MNFLKKYYKYLIYAGSIIMLGYHAGSKFELLPIQFYNITNIPFILAYFFWISMGVIVYTDFMEKIRYIIEQDGDNLIPMRIFMGFFLLLDLGYILSFISLDILWGISLTEFCAIICGVILLATLYAFRPIER